MTNKFIYPFLKLDCLNLSSNSLLNFVRLVYLLITIRFPWLKPWAIQAHRFNSIAYSFSCRIFLVLAPFLSHSQINTSVQAVVQVIPPYSLTLSDYTSAENDKLNVSLFLNDPTLTSIEVKLRVRIESDKLTLITKPEFIPTKIILEDKEWLNLTGADLAEYFKLENLNIQGSLQQGRLPEGLYRFCIEVLEYKRGVAISNLVCSAPVWMILNDPPIWQLPRNNEVVEATFPQNLLFSWMPRHTGSPNALFDVEYELHVEPIFNNNVNPQAIPQIQSTFNFIETDIPNYIMNGGDAIQLEPGQKYAAWIKAKDRSGKDLFRNNGLSEVLVFTFGQKCQTPGDPIIITDSYKQANISWTGNANNNEYLLSYHEKGQKNDVWYTQTLYLTNYQINDLKPNTTYEVKLKANCASLSSDETSVISFTTPQVPANTFVCNDPNANKLPPLKKTRKQSLNIGDIIKVRDYQVKIVQVSGSNGVFSGKGIVTVPFLQNVGLEATFSNIGVNEENKLTSGRVEVISGQVAVIDQEAQATVSRLKTLLTTSNDANSNDKLVSDVDDFLQNTPKIPVFARALIEQGKNQIAQGQAMVAAGNTEAGEKLIAQGKSGLQQGLNKAGAGLSGNGGIVSADAKPKTINSDPNATITFSKAENTVYGYDAYKDPLLKLKYEKVIDETGKKEIYPDWKALESGKPDYVSVKITASGTYKADSVKFQTEDGIPIAKSGNALTLIGGTDGSDTRVYATYKSDKEDRKLAQINVASYDKIENTIYIVPINGAVVDAQAIQTYLNTTYQQAVASFKVELKPSFALSQDWDEDKDGKILVNASGLLSNYTKDMNNIIKAYKAANDNIDKEAYYLFVGLTASEAGQKGYMPRAKHFGFIFSNDNKTIAHELGHGAFHLKHTFDETSVPKGSSQNLMDYTDQGAFLNKYQWDYVHNPAWVIGLLESDAAGALSLPCLGVFDDCEDVLSMLELIRSYRMQSDNKLIDISASKGSNKTEKEGNFLKIDGNDYNKISIIKDIDANIAVKINPVKFEDYKQSFLDKDGKSSSENGYIWRDSKGKIVLKILIKDEKEKTEAKVASLAKYLFGKSSSLLSDDYLSDVSVVKLLKMMKATIADGKLLNVHKPNDKGVWEELSGTEVKIENTSYQKIRLKNFAKAEVSQTDMREYKTSEKEIKKAASIEFYNKDSTGKVLFTVTVFDEDFKAKRDSLKRYLFGKIKYDEQTTLTDKDFEKYAQIAGVEVASFKSIGKQESSGGGFSSDGKAKILFERHKMYSNLKKYNFDADKYMSDQSDIVNSQSGGYGLYSIQHEKLERAKKINVNCAIISCSWGFGQVLGEYWDYCYENPQDLEKAMNASIAEQLRYMAEFIKRNNTLVKALNDHDWEKVAENYNGQSWQTKNPDYADNLEEYYEEFK